MPTITKPLEIYLENRDDYVEIDVEVEYEIQNNGIGSYEYWGQKCFDKGTDFPVITDCRWDHKGFTAEEIRAIEDAIENEKNDWVENIDLVEE